MKPSTQVEEVTVAVVLALTKEVRGAEVMFADKLEDPWGTQHGFQCGVCQIPSRLSAVPPHTVVLAQPTETGNNHAAICVTRLAMVFPNLEAVICCGVAGGAPTIGDPERDMHLGDVVIANGDGVFQYDFGHHLRRGNTEEFYFDPRRHPRRTAAEFLNISNALMTLASRGEPPWVSRLNERLPLLTKLDPRFNRPPDDPMICAYEQVSGSKTESIIRVPPYQIPRLFPGAIGSANRLLRNPFERDRLRDGPDGRPRVLAIEMEGAGIADACHSFSLPFTIVRGISDYCDGHKKDAWQFYAAATAASCAYAVIERLPTRARRARVQVVGSTVQADTAEADRMGVQGAPVAANSASATVTLTGYIGSAASPPSREPSRALRQSDPHSPPADASQVNPTLESLLREMQLAEGNREWRNLFQIAQRAESLLMAQDSDVVAAMPADALYEVAKAYITWSNHVTTEERQQLRSRAHELMKVARGLLNGE